jgi:hypothetical protein
MYAVAASAVLLLAGCGGTSGTAATSAAPSSNGVADLTADQILAKTTEAAKAQSSAHVAGKGTSGGQAIALDVHLRKGGGGYGTITLGANTLQIVSTGTQVYFKGDKAFWTSTANAKAAELIGDRWLKAPSSNASFASLAELADFDAGLTQFLKPDGAITKGDVGTASGQKAIALVSTSGKLWVATTGDPLPIRIDTGTAGESLNFSDWGATVDIPVPADKDTIDLSALGG